MVTTTSESTRQVRSRTLQLPILIDELPPWAEVLEAKVDHRMAFIVLTTQSFYRMFAGREVKRIGSWNLSILHDSIYFSCNDYSLPVDRHPDVYWVPTPAPPADPTALISDGQAKADLRLQTV